MSKFLVCYDVTDNRERLKIEKLASRFGLRLQKSIFWCVQAKNSRSLQNEIERLQIKTGSVLLFPAPPWVSVQAFGDVKPVEADSEAWVVD
jgi:CRISPR-associated endonuclease Cas2